MHMQFRILTSWPSKLSRHVLAQVTHQIEHCRRQRAVGELDVLTSSGECCNACQNALKAAFETAVKGKIGDTTVHDSVSDLEASASNDCTVCQILLQAIAYSELQSVDPEDRVAICLTLSPSFYVEVLTLFVGYQYIEVPLRSRVREEGEARRTASVSLESPAPSEWMPSDAASSIDEAADTDGQDASLERSSRSLDFSAPSLSSNSLPDSPALSVQSNEDDGAGPERERKEEASRSEDAGAAGLGAVEHAGNTNLPEHPPEDVQICGMMKDRQYDPRPIIYNPRENIGSMASLAKQWLAECSCTVDRGSKPNATSTLDRRPLPTRVIDVGSYAGSLEHQNVDLKLHETLPGESGDYVTLSYCWGSLPNTGRTTAGMLGRFRQKIPWDIVPLTIQDAIVLVRHIGIRYLWVDALCIIQADQVGGQSPDFEREAVRLSDYYENSVFTIAAASASDSSKGLFTTRMGAKFDPSPCSIHTTNTLKEWQRDFHLRAPFPDYRTDITDSILLGRGWVTQEIEFSTRVLFFGRNCLAWKCRTGWRLENGSTAGIDLKAKAQGCPHCNDVHKVGIGELMQLLLNPYETDHTNEHDHGHARGLRWLKFVETYSKTHFTQPRDRLIALSSLVRRMGLDANDEYVGGIWRSHLLQGLTWFLGSDYLETEQSRSHAPSWSWASVSGEVYFPPEVEVFKTYTSVQDVVSIPTQVYMPGANVILHMRGLLGELNLLRHSARRWGYFKRWKPFGEASFTRARCWRSKIVNQPFVQNINYHGPWSPGMLILDQMHPRHRFLGDMPGPFTCLVLYTHRNFTVVKSVRSLFRDREDAICLLLERVKPQQDTIRGTTVERVGLNFYRRIGVVELQNFNREDLSNVVESDFCLI